MRKLLFFAILAGVLFMFNPDPDAFNDFIKEKATGYFQDNAGSSDVGESLAEAGGSVSSWLARQATRHDDYKLFSLYTIDLDGRNNDENEWKFVGVAGQFFEIHRPENLNLD